MLKKILISLCLSSFATAVYADYFYTYTNPLPLNKTLNDPPNHFDASLNGGGLFFITKLELAPSTTYDISTRFAGSYDIIFTRYVGFNINGTKFAAAYYGGEVTTDENSQIIAWNIWASNPEPWAFGTSTTGDMAYYFGGAGDDDTMTWRNLGGGSWTTTIQAIPEPSTLAFLLTGLVTLGLIRRYRTEG